MDDLKFEPVVHDHKDFLEKSSKLRGFSEAYEALGNNGKLEYEIETKTYTGILFNVIFTFRQNIDLNLNFNLFFAPIIENFAKKYGMWGIWINDLIVNNLEDFKIVMKDVEMQALLAASNNAAADAHAANLKAKAAADAHSEVVFEYSEAIKEYNNANPR